jgi:hypothetical protein
MGLPSNKAKRCKKMVLRTVFMQGWFDEEKEAELRSMDLLIDTKVSRMDNCAKLSRTGSEIAQKLMIAEIDDMAASD